MSSPGGSTITPSHIDKEITLKVGERVFNTRRETLTEKSHWFDSYLTRWNSNRQQDEPVFVDADGDVFSHVLRYLRHDIFPLFYSASKGHDYALYHAVHEQARFFQIPRLERWIEEKSYLTAVQTWISVEALPNLAAMPKFVGADTNVECHPIWKVEKVYLCPRGIPVHRGRPEACGRACRDAGEGKETEYEDEGSWIVAAVRKKTVFLPEKCSSHNEAGSS